MILVFLHLANLSKKFLIHSYFLNVHRSPNLIFLFYFRRNRKVFSTTCSVNAWILLRFNNKFSHLKLLKLLNFLQFLKCLDFLILLFFPILLISIKNHLNIFFIFLQLLLLANLLLHHLQIQHFFPLYFSLFCFFFLFFISLFCLLIYLICIFQ